VGAFTALETLDLSHNRLEAIAPAALAPLTALRRLVLSHNRLTALPEIGAAHAALHTLEADHNALAALPDTLGDAPVLATLDVSANALAVLPDALCRLRHLRTLNVSHNQLQALPAGLLTGTPVAALLLDGNPRLPAAALADLPGYDQVRPPWRRLRASPAVRRPHAGAQAVGRERTARPAPCSTRSGASRWSTSSCRAAQTCGCTKSSHVSKHKSVCTGALYSGPAEAERTGGG